MFNFRCCVKGHDLDVFIRDDVVIYYVVQL